MIKPKNKDCIFYMYEFTEDDFEYIYISIDFIKGGNQDLGIIPKRYYIYILYLLEKENPANEKEKENLVNSIGFFREMIEAEKIIYVLNKKEEKIIRNNIKKLDEFITKFEAEKSFDIEFDSYESEKQKNEIFEHLKRVNQEMEEDLKVYWQRVLKEEPNKFYNNSK